LLIQNECNAVLAMKIVPNDTRHFVQQLLHSIWTTEDRKVQTVCVYTDNARIDGNIIIELWKSLFPVLAEPDILQV
jgi:hypothetical protein